MNADAVSDWALECAVYANAAGMIELPYRCDDREIDRLLALYACGVPAMVAAQTMFARH